MEGSNQDGLQYDQAQPHAQERAQVTEVFGNEVERQVSFSFLTVPKPMGQD